MQPYLADTDTEDPDLFGDADTGDTKKLTEEDPLADAPAPPADDFDATASLDPAGAEVEGGGHEDAIKNLITAILNDGSLSLKQKKDKINDALAMFEDPEAGMDVASTADALATETAPPLEEGEGDDADPAKLEEDDDSADAGKKPCDEGHAPWADPNLELEFLRNEKGARKLCESMALPAAACTETFLENLATYGEAKQRELIADRLKLLESARPKPAPTATKPVKEGTEKPAIRLPRVASKDRPRSAAPAALREAQATQKGNLTTDDFIAEIGL